MGPAGSFQQLMAGLRDRDPGASTAVFQRYARRVVGLARQHLGARLRRRVDPEDVLQSVFSSFFQRTAAGEFDIESEHDLWRLLVRLTLNKCGGRARFEQAARRDVRRDRDSGAATVDEDFPAAPSPVEATILADTITWVHDRLSTDTRRRVFEMSLQGHGVAEISDALGYYERGVERIRAEIRDLLLAQLAGDGGTLARCA